MSYKNEFHLTIESEGLTALDVLAKASDLSRQKIKKAMQMGCVWLEHEGYTKRIRRAKKVIDTGAVLHFYYNEKVLAAIPPEAQLIADEGNYSIWDKPFGMLSQGSKWGDHCTIYRWSEKHLKPERLAFIVHRLDRAASGLIIIAHKKRTAAQFAEMFQKHKVIKHYQALVEGDFSDCLAMGGSIKVITSELDGKSAESHVRLLELINDDTGQRLSLLDVEIKTGRKHQIRKHLAGIGFPIVGDRLYGSGKSEENLQLKAVLLSFKCPSTNEFRRYSLIDAQQD